MNLRHKCILTELDTVDSTNTYAKKEPLGDVPIVVLAKEQTAGRGTHGKSFFSPCDAGLYMTIGFRPAFELDHALTVTRLAGVVLKRVLKRYSLIEPMIKPVNDIYIDGKKVAGILTEAETAGPNRISAIYVGFGINCFKSDFPDDIKESATYIEHPSRPFTTMELAEDIANEFFDLIGCFNPEEIIKEYESGLILR